MADEPSTPEQERDEPRTVPYARFQEVNEQHKALKQQLSDVQAKLREREEAEMSVVERERAQRERLEQELTDLRSKTARLERGQLLVEAARKAGFADPTDAAALLDPSSIETEAQARRAVRELSERKPHLVAPQNNVPELGQVLRDGDLVNPANSNAEQIRNEARRQLNDDLRAAAGVRPQ